MRFIELTSTQTDDKLLFNLDKVITIEIVREGKKIVGSCVIYSIHDCGDNRYYYVKETLKEITTKIRKVEKND